MPRIHCPAPLRTGDLLDLPAAAARHVQVLRMQPGDSLTLFNGGFVAQGAPAEAPALAGEFAATITRMGRSDVGVEVGAHDPVEREAPSPVHLVLGMPANERMDWLVEKATELGVASIQPLISERSVLRLSGERAEKKVAHWQAIAIAACEQCGRNQVPLVHPVLRLDSWLAAQPPASPGPASGAPRFILSLQAGTQPLQQALDSLQTVGRGVTVLSGPEGGLGPQEEAAALAQGFRPVSLGARTLRAETAALAALVLASALALAGCASVAQVANLKEPRCAEALEAGLATILAGEGETPDAARTLAQRTGARLAGAERGPRPFGISAPSGTDYSFFVQKKPDACLLHLVGRRKGFMSYTNNLSYIATQPLPGCACSE